MKKEKDAVWEIPRLTFELIDERLGLFRQGMLNDDAVSKSKRKGF
jgi:hypothetical protein